MRPRLWPLLMCDPGRTTEQGSPPYFLEAGEPSPCRTHPHPTQQEWRIVTGLTSLALPHTQKPPSTEHKPHPCWLFSPKAKKLRERVVYAPSPISPSCSLQYVWVSCSCTFPFWSSLGIISSLRTDELVSFLSIAQRPTAIHCLTKNELKNKDTHYTVSLVT